MKLLEKFERKYRDLKRKFYQIEFHIFWRKSKCSSSSSETFIRKLYELSIKCSQSLQTTPAEKRHHHNQNLHLKSPGDDPNESH